MRIHIIAQILYSSIILLGIIGLIMSTKSRRDEKERIHEIEMEIHKSKVNEILARELRENQQFLIRVVSNEWLEPGDFISIVGTYDNLPFADKINIGDVDISDVFYVVLDRVIEDGSFLREAIVCNKRGAKPLSIDNDVLVK